jgi:hypothetical protein
MKRNLIGIFSLVALGMLFTATGSQAQSVAKADVPFAFQVGSKQLPAGCYRVLPEESSIQIRNCNTSAAALSAARTETGDGRSRLVFHRIGGQYFLSQVWSAGSAKMIPVSRQEKQVSLASASPKNPEEVFVALK